MSKSPRQHVAPQDSHQGFGADILRLWVASQDYTDDQRIGPEIMKGVADSYRKLRNTLRWMLGTLAPRHGDTARPPDGAGAGAADAAPPRRDRRRRAASYRSYDTPASRTR
jgi:isoleucyl-tRNA synthetase